MAQPFKEVFDSLELRQGDSVFLHASISRFGGSVCESVNLLETLLERLGEEGTLLMPAFHWHKDPPENGIMDVELSRSDVGLVSEIFRRMPGSYRSEHYWLSICGRGARVEEFLSSQREVVHPFGPGSTLRISMEQDVKIVGLGASLNTSSFAHLPDYDLEFLYPQKIFSEKPRQGTVIGHDRKAIPGSSIVFNPILATTYIAEYKPSHLFDLSQRLLKTLRRSDQGEAICFSYSSKIYYEEAIRLGKEALSKGERPPWL